MNKGIQKYIEIKKANNKTENTIKGYLNTFTTLENYFKKDMEEITFDEFLKYINGLKSQATKNNKIIVLKNYFRVMKFIREEIDSDCEQLKLAQGYDHNFVLNNQDIGIRKIAEASSQTGDIAIEVYSDQPGLQFYAGNTMKETIGKGGAVYKKRGGFCMEPQFYPNSINIENFKSPIFDKGEEFKTTTIYQFV